MHVTSYLYIFVGFGFLYKLINNTYNWYKICYYENKYDIYLKNFANRNGKNGDYTDDEVGFAKNLIEQKTNIISLFKEAGLQDRDMIGMVPIGAGYIQQRVATFFDNLLEIRVFGDTNIPIMVAKYFIEAKGVYKTRFFETFSPLFWVKYSEKIVKQVFSYSEIRKFFLSIFSTFNKSN